MTNWNALIKSVETVEEPARGPLVVEAPAPLVVLLEKLRKPGPAGGRQRAKLPVNGEDPRVLRASLKAAADKLDPPASVTVKPVYASDDEYMVWTRESEGNVETVREQPEDSTDWSASVRVRDGAVPLFLSFTVGNKRGKRAAGDPTSE